MIMEEVLVPLFCGIAYITLLGIGIYLFWMILSFIGSLIDNSKIINYTTAFIQNDDLLSKIFEILGYIIFTLFMLFMIWVFGYDILHKL